MLENLTHVLISVSLDGHDGDDLYNTCALFGTVTRRCFGEEFS